MTLTLTPTLCVNGPLTIKVYNLQLGTSVLSHRSGPELKKKATSVRSSIEIPALDKQKTPSIISLSEARVLLSRQGTTTRIVSVTGGCLEKKGGSLNSKTGESLQKKSSCITTKRSESLKKKSSSVSSKISKPASIVRKSSSIKGASLPSLPKRKHIPKKIFEPGGSEPITPKKQTRKKVKSKKSDDSKPNERALLYLRGEFVALKTDDGKKFHIIDFNCIYTCSYSILPK